MGIKNYRPTSPGRRQMSVSDFSEITRSEPERIAARGPHRTRAAAATSTATSPRGTAAADTSAATATIDFRRDKVGIPARVASIEYDPNRSANIALLHYVDGEKRYIIAPAGLQVGDKLMSGDDAEIRTGNALPLARIPLGSIIHAVEMQARQGRAAGARGRARRAADGARGHLRDAAHAQRRAPARPRALHGDARTGRQRRSREPQHRQGGPLALAGQAARTCAASR